MSKAEGPAVGIGKRCAPDPPSRARGSELGRSRREERGEEVAGETD